VIGLIWMAFGVCTLANAWSPAWSHEPNRWAYAEGNLLGPTDRCGASECLDTLMYTAPFIISIAYSVGAAVRRDPQSRRALGSLHVASHLNA
jgi:hypothetical protein